MSQRSRRIHVSIGLMSAAVVGMGLISAPATADTVPAGTVKGLVTIDGVPLAGAKVTLVARDGDSGDSLSPFKTVTTNSAGRYSMTRPRGSSTTVWYDHVVVSDPKARAVTDYREFMSNDSTSVTRNVTLKPAASITGKVTRADGSSPTSSRVEVVDGPDPVLIENLDMIKYDDTPRVQSNGTYRFVGLPAGTYTICYRDTKAKYLDECYDSVISAGGSAAPNPVYVQEGASKTLRAQVLDHVPARVHGKVTSTTGEPVYDAIVSAVTVGTNDVAAATRTSSSGEYDLAVPAGDVQLKVQQIDHETRWYDSATRTNAKVFSLAEGDSIDNRATVKLRSLARIDVTAEPGTGKATFMVEVTRRATRGHPGGKVTVSRQGVSRTVTLAGGKATTTLTGIPAGNRTFYVDYTATTNTAGARKTIKVRIG